MPGPGLPPSGVSQQWDEGHLHPTTLGEFKGCRTTCEHPMQPLQAPHNQGRTHLVFVQSRAGSVTPVKVQFGKGLIGVVLPLCSRLGEQRGHPRILCKVSFRVCEITPTEQASSTAVGCGVCPLDRHRTRACTACHAMLCRPGSNRRLAVSPGFRCASLTVAVPG
jgi:hypothetical protein